MTETGEIDALTLARAARGDRDARLRLIETYQIRVFSVVSRVLGRGSSDVGDVAQETFVRTLESLTAFDPKGAAKLSTWICTIAVRLAIDVSRRRARVVPIAGFEDVSASSEEAIDEALARKQRATRVQQALARLGPDHHAILVLRIAHEMELSQIAIELGIEVGTVKSRLHRARGALAVALGEQTDEEERHG
jgi:RNA polymerase sigma-70 factor, ECF subfamily